MPLMLIRGGPMRDKKKYESYLDKRNDIVFRGKDENKNW
jgi:hypothetical protein